MVLHIYEYSLYITRRPHASNLFLLCRLARRVRAELELRTVSREIGFREGDRCSGLCSSSSGTSSSSLIAASLSSMILLSSSSLSPAPAGPPSPRSSSSKPSVPPPMTFCLQSGQEPLRSVSHGMIQSVWKAWPHRGSNRIFSPASYSSMHMEQDVHVVVVCRTGPSLLDDTSDSGSACGAGAASTPCRSASSIASSASSLISFSSPSSFLLYSISGRFKTSSCVILRMRDVTFSPLGPCSQSSHPSNHLPAGRTT
mmetsp:Transcript_37326/g.81850  ORF Transcript_37326/g.81850 Transcript_37326/m.81850 type:complete len:256 (+) Transcript_37326:386-1153(+)